jgi:thiol-disulfide isomerase/thioredoxin
MSAGKIFVLLMAGAALGIGAGAAVWFSPGPPAGVSSASASIPALPRTAIAPAPAPIVGAAAPDFTLMDLASQAVTLAAVGRQAVLINFWATWCDPCREELPLLDRISQKYAGSLKVIAVETGESAGQVRAFTAQLSITSLTVLLDPAFVVRDLYLVRGLPTSFFIDSNGTVRRIKIGVLDSSEIDSILSQMGVAP